MPPGGRRGKRLRAAVLAARSPETFRGSARVPGTCPADNVHWVVPEAGEGAREFRLRVNPRIWAGPAAAQVVRLYLRHRGGMAPGPLPEAGGVNDQPAWLMDAFGMLAGIEAAWDRAERAARAGEGG